MSYQVLNGMRLYARDAYFVLASQLRKFSSSFDDRIILCNSIPKSGTHLLSQIIETLGYPVWNDILSFQSLSGTINTKHHIGAKFGSAQGGSIVRAHLPFNEEILAALSQRVQSRFFIYRDPRDIVTSFANWVVKEPRYFLHHSFRAMPTQNERISATIKGIYLESLGSQISYPDISTYLDKWLGWINDEATFSVRFEDLVGERGGGHEERRTELVQAIASHLGINDLALPLIESCYSYVLNPESSHTFRKGLSGGIGSWKTTYSQDNCELFKQYAGHHLIKLGYEHDYDWMSNG